MNNEWSLERLYKGYDDPKFAADEAKLDSLIAEMTEFAKDLSGDPVSVLRKSIGLSQELELVAMDLYSFASLQMSTNTSDVASAAASGRFAQKLSALAAPRTALVKYIASIEDLDAVIRKDGLLMEHEFYLKNIKEEAVHTLSPEVEQAISLYEITGSDAWSDLQGFLTSTVPVEYKGDTTTLSDIRNKAYDPDPEVRRSAYEAELKAYDRIKDSIAYSLNSIKLEVINHCKLRGYESPLAETLEDSHMKRETLDALLGAMEEYLPKFWEYMKAKARLLGHENGLPFYDLFAPLEGNDDVYTTEDAKDYLVKLFSGFDREET
ncbi:MAG: peptidase M3, partial [Oscillospiraceae bacterium]|nr:peptidase M3 [Oscillospiraceae bacterium]